MPEIEFQLPAGEHTLWSNEAAFSLIGTSFSAKESDKLVGEGTVIKAHVEDEGRHLVLLVEWPSNIFERINSASK